MTGSNSRRSIVKRLHSLRWMYGLTATLTTLSFVTLLWMALLLLTNRVDILTCNGNEKLDCQKNSNRTTTTSSSAAARPTWTCKGALNGNDFSEEELNSYVWNREWDFKGMCYGHFSLYESLYKCEPRSACDYRLFALLQTSVTEIGFNWYLLLHLRSILFSSIKDMKNSQVILKTAKGATFIQAFLALLSLISFKFHKVTSISIPFAHLMFALGFEPPIVYIDYLVFSLKASLITISTALSLRLSS